MLNKKALAGTPSTPPVYVEDVFSTYLFAGSSSSKTIINGIDLAGEGGMVWLKGRNANDDHVIYDTARGSGYPRLYPNTSGPQATTYPDFDSFNSNGFTIGYDSNGGYSNVSGTNYVSWTFRKAPKFFDIVTYTGDGSTSKLVNHSLESVPGMIMIKRLNGTGNWFTAVSLSSTVYGIAGGGGGSGYEIALNRTDEYYDNPLKSTIATSTTVDVPKVYYNDATKCNASGATYVMYLFASNAGGFGAAGTDNIITCGSYVGDGTTKLIDVGFEPQFILIKRASGAAGDWIVLDSMRGFTVGNSALLKSNSSGSETSDNPITIDAKGFYTNNLRASGASYIYMAIRRPMKTPTSGTEVFAVVTQNGGSPGQTTTSNFPVDLSVDAGRSNNYGASWFDRLRGRGPYLLSAGTSNEGNQDPTYYVGFDSNTSVFNKNYGNLNGTYINWMFRRATGFFDVVCYTGTGSARTISHNLGAVPELMIVKSRSDSTDNWCVYSATTGNTKYLYLNDTIAASTFNLWNDTTPTSTVFSVSSGSQVNGSAKTYVAYLFATLAGVSKVGSYTGDGTDGRVINCGFTGGARFVLIKSTSNTGHWRVWDTARGIVSGNDPVLRLNTTDAEVTNSDDIDPTSSGFIVNYNGLSAINESGWEYIYLAIA